MRHDERTLLRSWRHVTCGLALAVALVACTAPDGGADTPGAEGTSVSPESTASQPPDAERPSAGPTDGPTEATEGDAGQGDGDQGLTAEEALAMGALYASRDATLTEPKLVDGVGSVKLTNVGSEPDRYTIEVEPAIGGVVTPTTVFLEPGESLTVHVETHLGALEVRALSRARQDMVIASAQLSDPTRTR